MIGTAVTPFRWGINVSTPSSRSCPRTRPDSGDHPAGLDQRPCASSGVLEWAIAEWHCVHAGTSHNLLSIFTMMLIYNYYQINSLNYPADLSFNLTESPWIRAGRQYTVRVNHSHSFSLVWRLTYTSRTSGHIPPTALLCAISLPQPCPPMGLSRCLCRTRATSRQGCGPRVQCGSGARRKMESLWIGVGVARKAGLSRTSKAASNVLSVSIAVYNEEANVIYVLHLYF